MVDINLPNFVTIGLVSLVVIAAVRAGLKMAGVQQSYI